MTTASLLYTLFLEHSSTIIFPLVIYLIYQVSNHLPTQISKLENKISKLENKVDKLSEENNKNYKEIVTLFAQHLSNQLTKQDKKSKD